MSGWGVGDEVREAVVHVRRHAENGERDEHFLSQSSTPVKRVDSGVSARVVACGQYQGSLRKQLLTSHSQ